MTVIEALENRKSVRAFLNKEVKKEDIIQILESAKNAPSGVNTQPWMVSVVSGKKKREIEKKIVEMLDHHEKAQMDYNYYPLTWEEPYKSRRKSIGLLMYETLNIQRDDKARQLQQWRANYRAFDAPTVLYFFIDANLEKGSFLDYGMFLQSIMLTATQLGLATCPQASLAEFPDVVREALEITSDKVLLCGMALGYEDKDALVNSFKTKRIALEDFVTFYI